MDAAESQYRDRAQSALSQIDRSCAVTRKFAAIAQLCYDAMLNDQVPARGGFPASYEDQSGTRWPHLFPILHSLVDSLIPADIPDLHTTVPLHPTHRRSCASAYDAAAQELESLVELSARTAEYLRSVDHRAVHDWVIDVVSQWTLVSSLARSMDSLTKEDMCAHNPTRDCCSAHRIAFALADEVEKAQSLYVQKRFKIKRNRSATLRPAKIVFPSGASLSVSTVCDLRYDPLAGSRRISEIEDLLDPAFRRPLITAPLSAAMHKPLVRVSPDQSPLTAVVAQMGMWVRPYDEEMPDASSLSELMKPVFDLEF